MYLKKLRGFLNFTKTNKLLKEEVLKQIVGTGFIIIMKGNFLEAFTKEDLAVFHQHMECGNPYGELRVAYLERGCRGGIITLYCHVM